MVPPGASGAPPGSAGPLDGHGVYPLKVHPFAAGDGQREAGGGEERRGEEESQAPEGEERRNGKRNREQKERREGREREKKMEGVRPAIKDKAQKHAECQRGGLVEMSTRLLYEAC